MKPTIKKGNPMSLQAYAALGVFAVLLVGISSCSSVTVIDTGHRGVKTQFGKVEGEPLTEGVYFTSPFTTSIHSIDIRTQKFGEELSAYTKDVQVAQVSYVINYSLNGTLVGELYKTVGSSYAEKLIPQVAQGAIKNAFGKWEAVDVISNREKVRSEIEAVVKAELAPRGVIAESVQLVGVGFSDAFDKAVEKKVIAIQDAEAARNRTVQISEQAKQTVISAQADAQAMRIKSEALSQNQNLVAYEAVQHWNGKLPDTVFMGNGPLPLMNITK
jgi:prohibitin 2